MVLFYVHSGDKNSIGSVLAPTVIKTGLTPWGVMSIIFLMGNGTEPYFYVPRTNLIEEFEMIANLFAKNHEGFIVLTPGKKPCYFAKLEIDNLPEGEKPRPSAFLQKLRDSEANKST